jgi:hypothetical protein
LKFVVPKIDKEIWGMKSNRNQEGQIKDESGKGKNKTAQPTRKVGNSSANFSLKYVRN